MLLYVTPAAATGVLPMEAIEHGTWEAAIVAVLAAGAFLWLAIRVFRLGLQRYQSASYVMARH